MKHIVKGSEPQSFSEWKANDKMCRSGKPKWKRLPKAIKDDLLESLKKEQGYICCYCEQKLETEFHPEHLKPKGSKFFPKLQFEYSNLLCSCQKELQKGEPRHCGNSKGSWYDTELLVSPLNPDCETKFTYTQDGYMSFTDDASKETIRHLELGIDKLNTLRKNAIEPFIIDPITFDSISQEDARIFAEAYLQPKNGCFNEFYTTIKYLFADTEV